MPFNYKTIEQIYAMQVDDPDDMEHDNDVSNTTFLNPSQDDKLPSANNIKCEMCNFSYSIKMI